ncbi:hypothetical protein CPC08DRAFT_823073 [Agrocybe pediades]|nr:hypothetical protein CPC08DRAFT_823073 [Agrocybe pediades]
MSSFERELYDTRLLNVITRTASGEPLPGDMELPLIISGFRLVLLRRYVHRTSLWRVHSGEPESIDGTVLYKGRVQPDLEDISITPDTLCPFYTKAHEHEEPILQPHELPTISIAYFVQLWKVAPSQRGYFTVWEALNGMLPPDCVLPPGFTWPLPKDLRLTDPTHPPLTVEERIAISREQDDIELIEVEDEDQPKLPPSSSSSSSPRGNQYKRFTHIRRTQPRTDTASSKPAPPRSEGSKSSDEDWPPIALREMLKRSRRNLNVQDPRQPGQLESCMASAITGLIVSFVLYRIIAFVVRWISLPLIYFTASTSTTGEKDFYI